MATFSTKNLPGSKKYRCIRVDQLAAPAGLSPDRVKLLQETVPAIDLSSSGLPFTPFGVHILLSRFPIPVIEDGQYFRPIGGLRLVLLAKSLPRTDAITVEIWASEILRTHPDFAVKEALLVSLLFGLDPRSAQDQLRRLHAALGKSACEEIFTHAHNRAGFEASFGVNRRGAMELPESPILNFAQMGFSEGERNEND